MADIIEASKLFLEEGLHLESRTIYVGPSDDDQDCDTTPKMAERVIKCLHLLDRQGSKPINILMYNAGGHVEAGMAIFDAIRQCKNLVRITVYGTAKSMGAIILQAADERVLAPNATLMIHRGVIGFPEDHFRAIEGYYEYYKKTLQTWEEELFLSKMKEAKPSIQLKKVQEMLLFDTLFTADKALEYGLIDTILVPPEIQDEEDDDL
jgi:ATP-dependent Clp endopeptidase proteolytic subunit ClpP